MTITDEMTNSKLKSPRIESIGWGKMKIESLSSGKDFKLWPGGGRPWDWKEAGTAHSPGIQVRDVEELVNRGCQTVILACGVFSRLKVTDEALAYLNSHGIETIATDTKRAVQMYHDCIDRDIAVGGLFHSTC